MKFNRRRFIASTLVAAPAVTFPAVIHSHETGQTTPDAKPLRIIHLVGDGMSLSTLSIANHFSQYARNRPLTIFQIQQQPATAIALMDMRSLNSLVTDSAAASSSWGSGSRVTNGALNWLPDGRNLRPLYALFAEQGWKRGLVTTTEITHATPAGFAATISSRDKAELIAEQYLASKIDVLLGGGSKFFDPAKRKDKIDLVGSYRTSNYTTCQSTADLIHAPRDRRCLGLFASSHLPYNIDLMHDKKQRALVPTLATMTQTAIDILGRESHFILQVESGRVDHACHCCDIPSAVHEVIALDEALEACLAYQQKVPETLIVLTTDHGNGNPGLAGVGSNDGSGDGVMAHIQQTRKSFPEILKTLGSSSTPEQIRDRVRECTAYKPSLERCKRFANYLQKKYPPLNDAMNSANAQLGQLLAHYYGVGWSSSSHTSDFVPLIATGPGAERFRGFVLNTDVFAHYTDLARIDYRNPKLPLLSESTPQADEVENIADYLQPLDTLIA